MKRDDLWRSAHSSQAEARVLSPRPTRLKMCCVPGFPWGVGWEQGATRGDWGRMLVFQLTRVTPFPDSHRPPECPSHRVGELPRSDTQLPLSKWLAGPWGEGMPGAGGGWMNLEPVNEAVLAAPWDKPPSCSWVSTSQTRAVPAFFTPSCPHSLPSLLCRGAQSLPCFTP